MAKPISKIPNDQLLRDRLINTFTQMFDISCATEKQPIKEIKGKIFKVNISKMFTHYKDGIFENNQLKESRSFSKAEF